MNARQNWWNPASWRKSTFYPKFYFLIKSWQSIRKKNKELDQCGPNYYKAKKMHNFASIFKLRISKFYWFCNKNQAIRTVQGRHYYHAILNSKKNLRVILYIRNNNISQLNNFQLQLLGCFTWKMYSCLVF